MFTEQGQKLIEETIEFGLNKFYNPYMGNFGFKDSDLTIDNLTKVLDWLESHSNYAFIYEEYEEEVCWWLTPKNLL